MNRKSVPENGRRIALGESAEDGLKAIYKLQTTERPVATSALAAAIGVTEPTATAMIKRLAKLGLLYHVPYRGVELTPAGQVIALEIIRRHRLLEAYLVQSLGLGWESVHAEAERLEHVISEELEDRMDAVLGHPMKDPHGDPIPTREGRMDAVPEATLSEVEPGQTTTIRSVPDDDPELLRYLAELGLMPDVRVEVLEKAPFHGPLVLAIQGETGTISIGVELAAALRVDGSTSGGAKGDSREVKNER